ncbi:MAG TPA: nicotinamide-nucleotide amidohydrolase family protein [Propionibacteriaceae bacterium]|nr:nicotinamide-nucleotide amidohydrolase family protein [Propionibacteriaceae bacterium]
MTDPVAEQVIAALRNRGETVATAESLTGGLIGKLLTDVAGASQSYLGGVISYATRLKAELVGVDPAVLAEQGPVADVTARQMAAGVARRCDATWGLAVTGVAGPDPQDGHPVGQVFVAAASAGQPPGIWVEELALHGDRAKIRLDAAQHALGLLMRQLST